MYISQREWRDWVVTADWTLKLVYSLEVFAAGGEEGRVRKCGQIPTCLSWFLESKTQNALLLLSGNLLTAQ